MSYLNRPPRHCLMVLLTVAGCECIPHDTNPKEFTVPRGGARPLVRANNSGGVPLGALDDQILQLIQPSDAGSHLRIWLEFEKAPGMKMLHVSPAVASNVDTFLSPFLEPKDSMPPLEVDTVACDSWPDGGFKQPLADGTWEMEEFCFSTEGRCPDAGQRPPFSKSIIKLERVAATISEFRLRPLEGWSGGQLIPINNMMRLDLTVRDIEASIHERIFDAAGTQWYPPPGTSGSHGISVAELKVECDLQPGPLMTQAGSGCGEPIITCTPVRDSFQGPHVFITGLSGMVMGINLADFRGVFVNELVARLTGGLRLHFEGFSAATPLQIDSTAMPLPFLLSMTGTYTDSCSHTPAPPPSTPAPIRGVVRVRSSAGAGELTQGDYVKPYRLRPEVKFDWTSSGPQAPHHGPLMPWATRLGLRVYGGELSKLLADGTYVKHNLEQLRFEASVELIREQIDTCWQKSESTEATFETLKMGNGECPNCLVEQAFLSVSFNGEDNLFTRELDALMGTPRLAIAGKQLVEFERVVDLLERELGDTICPGPNCPSSCPNGICEPWTRYDLVPSDLPDPGNGIPPVRFELWISPHLPVPDSFHHFDVRECPLPPAGDLGDRRIVEPSVIFPRLQADSAEFQSANVSVPNVDDPSTSYTSGLDLNEERTRMGAQAAAARSFVSDAEGPQSVQVTLKNGCPAHADRDPHLKDAAGAPDPCWKGKFILPEPGTVTVTRAFSGVTATRFALDDTVFGPGASESNSELLGTQSYAVTGTLDRSGLRFYTAVPQIYRDLGLTTATRDYRETSVDQLNNNPWTTAMFFDWQHGGAFPRPADERDHLRSTSHERWTTDFHIGHRFRYFADWNRDTTIAEWVADDPPSFCIAPEKLFVTARKMSFDGARLDRDREFDAGVILTQGTVGPTGPEISRQSGAAGTFGPVLR